MSDVLDTIKWLLIIAFWFVFAIVSLSVLMAVSFKLTVFVIHALRLA